MPFHARRPARLTVTALALAVLASLLGSASLTPVAQRDTSSLVVIVGKLEPADQNPERFVRLAGGTVLSELPVVDGFTARLPRRAAAALSHLPGVRFVSPNRSLHLLGQYGQDSGVASAVYTDVVRASKVWTGVPLLTPDDTGAAVTVALVDTGVNTSGDLAGQVVHSEDFTAEQDNQDNYGHGTFVAGLIAGTGAGADGTIKGVAPAAKIVSLKIAGRDGATDVSMVLEALEWLVTFKDTYGIRVVNLSLGFASTQPYTIDPLDFAVERVWNDGIVVVAAAGNTPGFVTAPGNDPFVITAGATNDHTTLTVGDDNIASFSGGGTTPDGVVKPDVYAPGRSVISSRSPGSTIDLQYPASEVGASYLKGSGTSFSTALVSGVAALTLAHVPNLTPDQVKQRIVGHSRYFGPNLTPGLVDAWGAAMVSDLTEANRGLTPSTGTGSLQATRGMGCLMDDVGGCLSDDDADALLGFDRSQYLSDSWAGSQWVGSHWVGAQSTDPEWASSQWQSSQWVGSQWVGSQWVGSQWVGSQWVGSQWVGSQWVAAPWSAWSMLPEM